MKCKVEIEGVSLILFNRFTEENAEAVKGKTSKKKNDEERVAVAYDKVYRLPGGTALCLPSDNIKKAMLEGCRFAGIKIGRRSAEPYMRPTVFFEDAFVPFAGDVPAPDGLHECSGRIPPKTGGRVMIRRPYLDKGWKLRFSLTLLDNRVTELMVRQSLEEAGRMVGLGDHRPEYGRFQVNEFKSL
ncbi:MAG: hypothetical protein KKB20_29005 [Proteobacteria bacterium]|nr:hypothetical protein [Pseudomonadota bacterium]